MEKRDGAGLAMTRQSGIIPRRQNAVPATIGVLIGAVGVSAAFAWSNTRYAEWITTVAGTESQLGEGLLFSAFPLALGLSIAVWRPPVFGLQLGESLLRWRVVMSTTVALCAVAAVALARMQSNPFSGADLVVQALAVPVSEELVFRGVLFTLVLSSLSRVHTAHNATVLAVLISGVAFGLAHLNNLNSYDSMFVFLQTANATVLGIAAGHLRAVTHSVYPAIVLHAAVNLVAVAM
jgi:membrane protease YdiL (CAAX protease family)